MGVSGAGLLIPCAACIRDAPISQLSTIRKAHHCHEGQAVLCKAMTRVDLLPAWRIFCHFMRPVCNLPGHVCSSKGSPVFLSGTVRVLLSLHQPSQRLTGMSRRPSAHSLHFKDAT